MSPEQKDDDVGNGERGLLGHILHLTFSILIFFLNVSLFNLNMDLNSKFIYTWIYKNLLKGALINKVLINKKCDIYCNLEKHEKNLTKINVIINKLTTHHFVSNAKKGPWL